MTCEAATLRPRSRISAPKRAVLERQFTRWPTGDITGPPRSRTCRVPEHLYGLSVGQFFCGSLSVRPHPVGAAAARRGE